MNHFQTDKYISIRQPQKPLENIPNLVYNVLIKERHMNSIKLPIKADKSLLILCLFFRSRGKCICTKVF